MFVFDRLYGELRFPKIVQSALHCPGILRLRQVRMANVPFLSFPSFSGVNRYEHSLGVCHLASLFATVGELSEKDKIEVMLAALYHDAATAPFAHSVEAVLAQLYGFNHEEKLREIILGKASDVGGQRTQLFEGRSLRVHQICQSKMGRELRLDPVRIANLAAGTKGDPLGDIISSRGIDLDNIDNVIRACTAMGIREFDSKVAEDLARNLVLVGNRVCIHEAALSHVEAWKKARYALYGMIYSSLQDFALQTMLKHAVRILAKAPEESRLREGDWCLTDDDFIHNRLMPYPPTSKIVTRMRLGEVYQCLALVWLEPRCGRISVAHKLGRIEQRATEIYEEFLRRKWNKGKLRVKVPEIIGTCFADQRTRSMGRETWFMGVKRHERRELSHPSTILGLFTPHHRRWDARAADDFRIYLNQRYRVKSAISIRSRQGNYPDVQEA